MDLTRISAAQTAMVGVLQDALAITGVVVRKNQNLADDRGEYWLNVVRSRLPPQILDEVLGLGADDVVVEYAQLYNLEWIVTREDEDQREAGFQGGLLMIQAALHADRTLAGQARGLTIGPPDFENHRLAFAPATLAVVIPVRVLLAGPSPIG